MSSIRQAVKTAVLARQGGRCAMGEACKLATQDGLGCDLEVFKGAKALHIKLPKGRSAVEFDHIIPRQQGGTDDADNVQALCGWCHHDKTELERPDWEAPSPSVFAERLASQGRKGINGPRPGTGRGGRAAKAMRLRSKAPTRMCG